MPAPKRTASTEGNSSTSPVKRTRQNSREDSDSAKERKPEATPKKEAKVEPKTVEKPTPTKEVPKTSPRKEVQSGGTPVIAPASPVKEPEAAKRRQIEAPTPEADAKKPAAAAARPQVKRAPISAGTIEQKPATGVKVPAKKPVVEPKKEFYALEDKLATDLGADAILANFTTAAEKMNTMLEAARKVKDPVPFSALATVAALRRCMRQMMVNNRQIKEEISASLKSVEQRDLDLQNTRSEIQHVQKEIARCLEFRSIDEEIELDPVELFYANAPEAVSNPEVTKDNEHEQRLARLRWEMQQREELTDTLSELEVRRNVLVSQIGKKEARLKSMRPKIKSVGKTVRHLRDSFGAVASNSEEISRAPSS
ncbi:unnamed protein product, partial [Mesorhabditis spiculigera]